MKIVSQQVLSIFIFTGCTILLFYWISLQYIISTSVRDMRVVDSREKDTPVDAGLPILLRIPKIGLDAHIEYVGITVDGNMDTPLDIQNVGWYEGGVRPGENGSAVIAGHYGWSGGKSAVFDKLHTLRVGDKLNVEDGGGKIATFIVRTIKKYNPADDASEVFMLDDGESHLNLIACEGEWNEVTKSYSERLVVFTDRI